MYVLCYIFLSVDEHFCAGGIAPIEYHGSSNWMILKRLASKKSKNDLVDASGAHFKVGDASRSGGRTPAKAINEQGESQVPLWILRCKKCHLGFALLALAGVRPPLLEASQ